jgi:hypothetical protein
MDSALLIYGDPHGRWENLFQAFERLRPAAVVILGDMELDGPIRTRLAEIYARAEVRWIPGNHEGDREDWYRHAFDSDPQGNLDGRAEVLAGIRVGGLGGVFRGAVWHPKTGDETPLFESRAAYLESLPHQKRWRGGLPRRHRATCWPCSARALHGQRIDLLVAHEASVGYERTELALAALTTWRWPPAPGCSCMATITAPVPAIGPVTESPPLGLGSPNLSC